MPSRYYADIQTLLNADLIEKVKRGFYHWIDKDNSSEVVIINHLFPDAVLCMATALFYYRNNDRNAAELHFSIDKNVAKQRTRWIKKFLSSRAFVLLIAIMRSALENLNSLSDHAIY